MLSFIKTEFDPKKYERFIRKVINDSPYYIWDEEQLILDGLEVAWKCEETYRANKGVSFWSYLAKGIKNCILDHVKKNANYEAYHISDEHIDDRAYEGFEKTIIIRISILDFISYLNEKYGSEDPLKRPLIFARLYEGENVREISEEIEELETTVRARLYRSIIPEFKQFWVEQNFGS